MKFQPRDPKKQSRAGKSKKLAHNVFTDWHCEGADQVFRRDVYVRENKGEWELIGNAKTDQLAWELVFADPRVGIEALIVPTRVEKKNK